MCTVAGLAGDNDLQNAEIGSLMDFVIDIGKLCEQVMKETDKEKQVSMYMLLLSHLRSKKLPKLHHKII